MCLSLVVLVGHKFRGTTSNRRFQQKNLSPVFRTSQQPPLKGVCVCVCERERERREASQSNYQLQQKSFLCFVFV